MLTIHDYVTPSPEQWMFVMRGMRNPMNSWEKMDSYTTYVEDGYTMETADSEFFMGDADHRLATTLSDSGSDHGKYLRMLPVMVEITAPLYWWKEFDTYKVGTVANSCSTMHKIHAKRFEAEDFSHEHLTAMDEPFVDFDAWYPMFSVIGALNAARDKYLETKTRPLKDESKRAVLMKRYWWHMIQLLPSSYNQKRSVSLNYQVLKAMYHARKNHKLDEWHTLCHWIEDLPYSELIIGEERSDDECPSPAKTVPSDTSDVTPHATNT